MQRGINEVQRGVATLHTIGTDERKDRMRQLANVVIEMFLEQQNKIAESSVVYAEAA